MKLHLNNADASPLAILCWWMFLTVSLGSATEGSFAQTTADATVDVTAKLSTGVSITCNTGVDFGSVTITDVGATNGDELSYELSPDGPGIQAGLAASAAEPGVCTVTSDVPGVKVAVGSIDANTVTDFNFDSNPGKVVYNLFPYKPTGEKIESSSEFCLSSGSAAADITLGGKLKVIPGDTETASDLVGTYTATNTIVVESQPDLVCN